MGETWRISCVDKGKNTISKWKSFKNNLIMVDISNMGDESLDKICRDIEKKKIQVLVTYSSALTALTQYIRKTGRDISRWSVEMVFSREKHFRRKLMI